MSDIRFNQWLHQSGTGGVTQLSSGHVGIGTTSPLIPVHSGNNAVLNVGVVTANNIYAGTLNGTLALSDISGITGSFTSNVSINGNLDIADKIRHIGDTDTAIRFPAADQIQLETGGSSRVNLTNDRFQILNRLLTSGDYNYLSGSSSSNATLTLKKSASGADSIDYLQLRDNSNGIKFTIHGDGTLKILDSITHEGDTDTKIRFPSDNNIQFETGGDNRLYINNSAIYVKSGYPLAFLASSGATPNIKSGGTNNQDLLFTSGSGNPTRLQIASGGNIGINSASPSQKLDVRGTTLSDKFTARSAPTSTYTTATTGHKFGARGSYALSIGGNRSSNGSSFTICDVKDFYNSKYFDIEISFCHAGGGVHGSYRRFAGICNGYTSIHTWEDTGNKNTGGALGFAFSKPDTTTLRVTWNGCNNFADGYTLYFLLHSSYEGSYFSYIDSAFY